MIDENGIIYDTEDGMRRIQLSSDNQGYKICHLVVNGKLKLYRVHRLLAATYIDNIFNYPQVNHKDGNKANNHISNLEWCSNRWNTICGYENNAYVFKSGSFVIDVYSPLTRYCIGRYTSIRQLCSELGMNRKTLRGILLGERSNIYNYRFIVYGKGQQTTRNEVASA